MTDESYDLAILVTGDREYAHERMVFAVLDGLACMAEVEATERGHDPKVLLIQGTARGADTMARKWAEARGVDHWDFPAKWHLYGNGAGPIRNNTMVFNLRYNVKARRRVCIAFHDHLEKSVGTKHCSTEAARVGIPTFLISRLDQS